MMLAAAYLSLAPAASAPPAPQSGFPGGRLRHGAVVRAIAFSGERVASTAASTSTELYPKNTSGYTRWTLVAPSDWTSGFFPGANWLLYEATGDASYRSNAEAWLGAIAPQRFTTTTHDLGFMFMTGFGNGHRITGNPTYADHMRQAALSLASRFSPTVGAIESWSWGPWDFPVVVDNLMNLELLFWAARNGGPAELVTIARTHALTSLREHVRPDGSTYHLVEFDRTTGELLGKSSWGGVATESTWSRGQAWAVYGFTMCCRETGDAALLEAAERTADWFLANLPADSVPYWDFDAPGIPDTSRDSSAAAIAASGLLELSTLASSAARSRRYFDGAERILVSLTTPKASDGYLAIGNEGAPISPGILMHGCSGHPESVAGINLPDESLIYGDYYFLEALLRHEALAEPHFALAPEAPTPRSR